MRILLNTVRIEYAPFSVQAPTTTTLSLSEKQKLKYTKNGDCTMDIDRNRHFSNDLMESSNDLSDHRRFCLTMSMLTTFQN